jgi:translation initiation factor IF-2
VAKKVRQHELAKEFGIGSKLVLRLLKEMGEFVRSAPSQVDVAVAARFRGACEEQLRAGTPPTDLVTPAPSKVVLRHRPPRRTSWDDRNFDATAT